MTKKQLINFVGFFIVLLLITQSPSKMTTYGESHTINHEPIPHSEVQLTSPEIELTKSEEILKEALLPSQSGYEGAGTFANYSNADPSSLRTNYGFLNNDTDQDSYYFSSFTGPLYGVFIVSLTWNFTLADDIDLYPGWLNSTGGLVNGFPSGVIELKGDYYSSANPEYYYAEVNLDEGETIQLASHVWGDVNSYIEYTLNATWVNFEEWQVGLSENPVPTINSPIDGESLALAALNHIPQRYILLNYSYTPGEYIYWDESSYSFGNQLFLNGYDYEYYDSHFFTFEVLINGKSFGQLGTVSETRLGLTEVGLYNITVNCVFNREVVGTDSVFFTIVGHSLGTTTITVEGGTTLKITQEFNPMATSPAPSSPQEGLEISKVYFSYHYQTSTSKNYVVCDEWRSLQMTEVELNLYEVYFVPITPIVILYYFTVIDSFGGTQVIYSSQAINLVSGGDKIETVTEKAIDSTESENNSPFSFMMTRENAVPLLLFPLAITMVSLLVIIRRRK